MACVDAALDAVGLGGGRVVRPKPPVFNKVKTVAENRRARFDYADRPDTFEAGIALTGTEVKALRAGEASIAESYAEVHEEQTAG